MATPTAVSVNGAGRGTIVKVENIDKTNLKVYSMLRLQGPDICWLFYIYLLLFLLFRAVLIIFRSSLYAPSMCGFKFTEQMSFASYLAQQQTLFNEY